MLAIFKREFKAYFSTPIGALILAIYFFFEGLFFYYLYCWGYPEINSVIVSMGIEVMFTVPVITMRTFSEDRKQKVDQILFTSPVKIPAMVFGKYLAAMALFALCFVPTVVFRIFTRILVATSIVPYLYSLLGVLLLGSALISIGMFVSSLTESIVVSAIITLVINILLMYSEGLASMINIESISAIASKMAFLNIFTSFGDAIFSVPNVALFLSVTAGFLFLCIRSLDRRRWA